MSQNKEYTHTYRVPANIKGVSKTLMADNPFKSHKKTNRQIKSVARIPIKCGNEKRSVKNAPEPDNITQKLMHKNAFMAKSKKTANLFPKIVLK